MHTADQEGDDASRRRLISAPVRAGDFAPAAALVRAEFAARSHRGTVQGGHDDHYLVVQFAQHIHTITTSLSSVDLPSPFEENAYAAVVADGIGRAGAGSMASRLALSTLATLALRLEPWHMRIDPRAASEVVERSEWLYRRASETVFQRSQTDPRLAGMAAAVTGLYSVGTDLFVAHVGHTRCYLFRDGVLVQLTHDHTLRERRAVSRYPIPVGQALEDVEHVLTHAVGAAGGDSGVIAEHFRLADNDSLLLCTNGLTDVVQDDAIADVLASRRNPEEQCDLLLNMALANGANDNTTVVVASYEVPPVPADLA